MYVSLDVLIWLQCRKSCGRPDVQRIGNYVLANTTDRRDFDVYRDSMFFKKRPLVPTDLLQEFMKIKNLHVDLQNEYGVNFVVNFPTSHFEELCIWARNIIYGTKVSDAGDKYI